MGLFLPLMFTGAVGSSIYALRGKISRAWKENAYTDADGDGQKDDLDIKGAWDGTKSASKAAFGGIGTAFAWTGDRIDDAYTIATGKNVEGKDVGRLSPILGENGSEDKSLRQKVGDITGGIMGGDPGKKNDGITDRVAEMLMGDKNDDGINWKGSAAAATGAGLLSLIFKKFSGTNFTGPFLGMSLIAFTAINWDTIKEFTLDKLGVEKAGNSISNMRGSGVVIPDEVLNSSLGSNNAGPVPARNLAMTENHNYPTLDIG